MIALGETDPTSAEVPFFLPSPSAPAGSPGITGHAFTLGEVRVLVPGGSFVAVPLSQIVEKDNGWYAVQLTAAQCVAAGQVFIHVDVSGSVPFAQPYNGVEDIGVNGGDIFVGAAGEIPFYLPQAVNPVYGPPVTGHAFVTGEVQVRFARGGLTSPPPASIREIGLGSYALQVAPTDAVKGKVFLYAVVSGAQFYSNFVTILSAGSVSPTPTPPSPVPSPVPTTGAGYVDHVALALARLPIQFVSNS